MEVWARPWTVLSTAESVIPAKRFEARFFKARPHEFSTGDRRGWPYNLCETETPPTAGDCGPVPAFLPRQRDAALLVWCSRNSLNKCRRHSRQPRITVRGCATRNPGKLKTSGYPLSRV